MTRALQLAQQGFAAGEVPVGAVVVADGAIVGEGYNQPVETCDPTAHAEIVALRAAGVFKHNYRLPDTTLYVTVEPCMMCAGALVHARISRLVFGARESKGGAVVSHQVLESNWLNHRVALTEGVCGEACSVLLSRFFAEKRAAKRAST